MKVAMTGVSGFIGTATVSRLAASGHAVTGLVRSSSRRDHINRAVDRFIVGDVSDSRCWEPLLEGADTLVHNAVDWAPLRENDLGAHLQQNLDASIRMIERAASLGVGHVVFVSSVAVHNTILDSWEGVIDTEHPTRPGGWYGAYKAAVEAHLWAARSSLGLRFSILRPSQVYGVAPDFTRSTGYRLLESLRATGRCDRLGGGKFVHVDDVSEAIVRSVDRTEGAMDAIIDLTDCYARWSDLATMFAETLGIDAKIDDSSPASPRNTFSKSSAEAIGVRLDRGHAGLRTYCRELVELASGTASGSATRGHAV